MPDHIEITLLNTILARVDAISKKLNLVTQENNQMAADLTALAAQVAQNTTVEQSAITLIQGLAAQVAAAGTDPAALSALVTQLNTSATGLAAAVTANTPASVPPAPATPGVPASS